MHGRTLAGVVILLTMVPALPAGHLLKEQLAANDCFRVELHMKLKGEMHFSRDGKKKSLTIEASADHVFPERILSVTRDGSAEKTARAYETARAMIQIGQHASERILRPERRLVVAIWKDDTPLAFSPAGPLYQSELELCSEHFDTLHLVSLLPGKEVNVGDTWKIGNVAVEALCHFEGLIEHTLVGKLERVEGNKAIVSIKGTANGIDLGSMSKLVIEAAGVFDLQAKRLTQLEWKQKDARDIGPASPSSSVESTTTVTRLPIKQPEALDDRALAAVPAGLEIPPQMLQMDYVHPKRVYDLLYLRDWTIVSATEEYLVLRLVDRGDFVAQATVAVWPKGKPGKVIPLADFAELMNKTQGWKMTKELLSGPVPSEKDRTIYRVSEMGELDGKEVVQNFFLVTHEDGRQVLITFTMTPKQADHLGTRDLTLAGSLDFPKAK
jgi:hypothetical protein